MSDYLNNLVARTLNLAPVVQPRLGSLFEPVSASRANQGSPWFESETPREDLSLTQTDTRAEIQIDTIQRDVKGDRRDHREQSRGAADQPHSFELIDPQLPARVASRLIIPEPDPSSPANRERGETSLIFRPRKSNSAGIPKRSDGVTAPPSRSFNAKAPAAEGPETITVRIGRVDVRAVFSPPPSTTVNRAQPGAPMSLAEYLKQRSGGHR